MIALSKALTKTTQANGLKNLVEVHLPTTKMGPAGAKALANFLTTTGSGSSLRILNVYGNEACLYISINCLFLRLKTLLLVILRFHHLFLLIVFIFYVWKHLNIQTCLNEQLGDEGAVSLSAMFAGNNHANIPLETLGIGVNNIGGIGATALATQLGDCTNCPLKTLGL